MNTNGLLIYFIYMYRQTKNVINNNVMLMMEKWMYATRPYNMLYYIVDFKCPTIYSLHNNVFYVYIRKARLYLHILADPMKIIYSQAIVDGILQKNVTHTCDASLTTTVHIRKALFLLYEKQAIVNLIYSSLAYKNWSVQRNGD